MGIKKEVAQGVDAWQSLFLLSLDMFAKLSVGLNFVAICDGGVCLFWVRLNCGF